MKVPHYIILLCLIVFVAIMMTAVVEGFQDSPPVNKLLAGFVRSNRELEKIVIKIESNTPLTSDDRMVYSNIPRVTAEELAQLKGQLKELDDAINLYVVQIKKVDAAFVAAQLSQTQPSSGQSNYVVCPIGCQLSTSPYANCRPTVIKEASSGKCYQECAPQCPVPNSSVGYCNYDTDCTTCPYNTVEVQCPTI